MSGSQHVVRSLPNSSSLLVVVSSSHCACAGSCSILAVILARLSSVRLSDFKAILATQRRSKFIHHLFGDVDASSVLFVSRPCRCRSSLRLWVRHWKCSCWCRRFGFNFHTSVMHAPGVHSEFLPWSQGLVWFEECLFADHGDLLFLGRIVVSLSDDQWTTP